MQPNNPYFNKKKGGVETPLMLKVPLYDFNNNVQVETDLLPEELCIARIPNTTSKTGYTHHVAIVYKDSIGDIYSIPMVQHHGELKEGSDELINAFTISDVSVKEEEAMPTKKFKRGKKVMP